VKVSVLMTVRDGERYLDAALRSVLDQTVAPAEVVVVDDGSTDGTRDVLATFGAAVRVVSQPAIGIASGLNRALAHARHEVIAYLDADDLWEPDAIELRVARLTSDEAAEAVGGSIIQFVSPDLEPAAAARFRVDDTPARALLLGAVIFRRESLRRLGPIDESVALAPTVDWMARARTAGIRVVWIEQVVLRRRIHTSNISITTGGPNYRGMLEVVRRHHARRKGSGGSA
jgi:glycosyltransferase involved in cell wall biosynthesis